MSQVNDSVQNSVYNALRESIINLNLAPGTAISEKEISLKFSVSRTPVREAFIHLSKEGLIRVIPQKETQVSLIDLARVEQEFFMRKSLETAVQEPFLENATAERFGELEKLLDLQTQALEKNSAIDFIKYDDTFHKTFFEGAGQNLCWEIISSMSGHYYRVRMLIVRISGIAEEKIQCHRNILDALKNHDPVKSRKLLCGHLTVKNEESLLRQKFPEFFITENQKDRFDVDFGGMPRME
ncbi:MAG: GntR family transcriptional regulator [Treponema sp.]|nr:GntR family transcriptional regulator [Treponema sp.]